MRDISARPGRDVQFSMVMGVNQSRGKTTPETFYLWKLHDALSTPSPSQRAPQAVICSNLHCFLWACVIPQNGGN